MAELLRQQLIGDGWTWVSWPRGTLELPAFLRHPRRGAPMGEVVRLPASTVALQDAVDAFLEHHDVAHSTRRVYLASLGGLAAAFGPGAALGDLSGPELAGWFRARHSAAAPATWNRERSCPALVDTSACDLGVCRHCVLARVVWLQGVGRLFAARATGIGSDRSVDRNVLGTVMIKTGPNNADRSGAAT
jgi:hypothetical protein